MKSTRKHFSDGESGAISFESAIGIGVIVLLALSSIQDLGNEVRAEYSGFGMVVGGEDSVCETCDTGGGDKFDPNGKVKKRR